MTEVWEYFLWTSQNGHGNFDDGRRLFYETLEHLIENSRPVEKATQAKTDEWIQRTNRNN